MDKHHSRTANISGFYLAHNTLLGLNELKYSLLIVNVLLMLVTPIESLLALSQPRRSEVFLA
jgi:hypothetical protein